MRGFQTNRRDDTGIEGVLPQIDTNAPVIAGLEARKTKFGMRRAQVVTDRTLMPEKLLGHFDADRVLADVVRTRIALAVTIEAGKRIGAASLQHGAEDVFYHNLERIAIASCN